MFRDNFLYTIPAIIILIYQSRVTWRKLPNYDKGQTLVNGDYGDIQKTIVVLINYLIVFLFIYQIFYSIYTLFSNQSFVAVSIMIGYVLIIGSASISKQALKELDYSWSPLAFFRIKKKQRLITSGIYKYSRHPIYMSIILRCVGYELIVNSWLFLPIFIFLFLVINYHINNEEKLLVNYWGKEYIAYKNVTKKIFPLIY